MIRPTTGVLTQVTNTPYLRLIHVMIFLPGFIAVLLLHADTKGADFGVTIELLMLSTASAITAGAFMVVATRFNAQPSVDADAEYTGDPNLIAVATGGIIFELMSLIPFIISVPLLFSEVLRRAPLDGFELSATLIPGLAVVPFALYLVGGYSLFGRLVPNWLVIVTAIAIVVGSTAVLLANRTNFRVAELATGQVLALYLTVLAIYSVMRLRQLYSEGALEPEDRHSSHKVHKAKTKKGAFAKPTPEDASAH